MRAAVIERPQTIRIVDAEPPVPGPGEVRVRMMGSGVCGSNLPVFEGRPWFTYPLSPGAPGHEGWGYIESLGSGVHNLAVGTPVAMLSQHAFAELDTTEAGQVVPLASPFNGLPFPAEAIACAVNVIQRSNVAAGQRVAIVGIGFLGAVLVRLAVRRGACVTAITRRRFALDLAASLGAAAQVPTTETSATVAEAKAANDNDEFDVVIEATGLQSPLDIASQLTRTRGRLVIAGYHQDGPRHVDMQMWNWRGLDVINAHERDPQSYVDGMREAARLVQDGELPLDRLVTHVFPIEAAGEAFRCALERPDGFLKAAVLTYDA
jgi:2-desacetyl-2-hydroxyethyl bacteriochlorophyllide A dehydrogenase